MGQYDYPGRNNPKVIVEESPWATFLNQLPDTVLAFHQLNQQLEWKSAEAALVREFTEQQNELSLAAGQYNVLQERLFSLEDQMKGYNLPYEITEDGSGIITGKLEDYKSGIEEKSQQISQINKSLGMLEEAGDFAKGKADLYGDLIEADKDEAWKDALFEGDITMGEGGELTGTGEMPKFLEKLRTGTPGQKEQYEKLKNENYRRKFLSSLRTAEEALALQASKEAIDTANLQQKAAEQALEVADFQLFQGIMEEFETTSGEIFKQQALDFTAQFRYGGYGMMDLVALGAADPRELIDIKEDFAKDYPNIAHDADKFLSGIQQAQANKVDPSRFVVQFYAKAYEDYLLLDEYVADLTARGDDLDMDYQEMYDNLPSNTGTKIEIDRLTDKVNGFKKLGIYGSGTEAQNLESLNHMYAITKMYDKQQAMRLSADVKEYERVAGYGLQLGPVESYYPEQYTYMDPAERVALEQSLAHISASVPPSNISVDTDPNASAFEGAIPSRSELDVFGNLPTAPARDYWGGGTLGLPMSWDKAGAALDAALSGPDILRPSYGDPNAPAGLASEIGASLDMLRSQTPDNGESYLAGVFIDSNFLRSTGITFSDLLDQWIAAGRPDPGDWLLDEFSDEANPGAGIEEELIR